VRNPVILGGDVHAHYVCDVHARAGDDRSPVLATEFCTTSITSPGLPQAQVDRLLPENRHVRLADTTRRGYLSMTLEPQRCTTRLRVVDDARDPATGVSTRATFVVEDRRPGALPA
jgi:alkaline phosphatase D